MLNLIISRENFIIPWSRFYCFGEENKDRYLKVTGGGGMVISLEKYFLTIKSV